MGGWRFFLLSVATIHAAIEMCHLVIELLELMQDIKHLHKYSITCGNYFLK